MKPICSVCNSDKISSEKKMVRTSVPKEVQKRKPNARISYGRVYYEHKCVDCGHVWEEDTHL